MFFSTLHGQIGRVSIAWCLQKQSIYPFLVNGFRILANTSGRSLSATCRCIIRCLLNVAGDPYTDGVARSRISNPAECGLYQDNIFIIPTVLMQQIIIEMTALSYHFEGYVQGQILLARVQHHAQGI